MKIRMRLKKFRRNRGGGSVIFAIVMSMLSLMTTSVLWYVFYPMVEGVAAVVDTTGNAYADLFSNLMLNTWTYLGVIMFVNVLMWAFAYTVKHDYESRYA